MMVSLSALAASGFWSRLTVGAAELVPSGVASLGRRDELASIRDWLDRWRLTQLHHRLILDQGVGGE